MTCASAALVLLTLLSGAPVPKGDQPNPAMSGPPWFVTVAKVDAEKQTLVLRVRVVVPVTQTVPVRKKVDGKEVTEMVTVYKHIIEHRMYPFSAERFTVVTGEGKKLSAAEALKRAKVDDVVLLTYNPRGVPAKYRKVLARDALIVIAAWKQPRGKKPGKR